MQERVIEILIHLIYEFNTMADSVPQKWEDISEKLMESGYAKHEINLAFSWLFDRLHKRNDELARLSSIPSIGVRILDESEKNVLRPEAYGYLIYLKELGLIDYEQMETVIERAMELESKDVDREGVKAIVVSLILEANDLNSWPSDFMQYRSTRNEP